MPITYQARQFRIIVVVYCFRCRQDLLCCTLGWQTARASCHTHAPERPRTNSYYVGDGPSYCEFAESSRRFDKEIEMSYFSESFLLFRFP